VQKEQRDKQEQAQLLEADRQNKAAAEQAQKATDAKKKKNENAIKQKEDKIKTLAAIQQLINDFKENLEDAYTKLDSNTKQFFDFGVFWKDIINKQEWDKVMHMTSNPQLAGGSNQSVPIVTQCQIGLCRHKH
jgi:hypothetical protein